MEFLGNTIWSIGKRLGPSDGLYISEKGEKYLKTLSGKVPSIVMRGVPTPSSFKRVVWYSILTRVSEDPGYDLSYYIKTMLEVAPEGAEIFDYYKMVAGEVSYLLEKGYLEAGDLKAPEVDILVGMS